MGDSSVTAVGDGNAGKSPWNQSVQLVNARRELRDSQLQDIRLSQVLQRESKKTLRNRVARQRLHELKKDKREKTKSLNCSQSDFIIKPRPP